MAETAAREPGQTAVIPRATYRLQLHKGFDFAAAMQVLPYLSRLGISHVYCSPISTARPGSLHGYDVVDHARINPELGGEAGFRQFAAAARALGMGLLLDVVPNHMGVFGRDNRWWLDVLEHGQASRYAHYFDIDWEPPNPTLRGKLLVPLLGDHYAKVLERHELRLRFQADAGTFALHYHEHELPLDPRSYGELLRNAASRGMVEGAALSELMALCTAFDSLPPRTETLPAAVALRRSAQQGLKQRLQALAAGESAVRRAIEQAVAAIEGSATQDEIDRLHAEQAYRVAYWRIAASEINYRRFFDINDLAALRVEEPDVFEATQGPALDLAAQGLIDGLRIDHPDGLFDPAAYFEALQQGYRRRSGRDPPAAEGEGLALYVTAEKIAAGFEQVPHEWALHGTTGYRFAMVVNGLFVERSARERLNRIWSANGSEGQDFQRIRYECKRQVATGALRSEITLLASLLLRIATSQRDTRDYGYPDLVDALVDIAACMPVYRTYVVEAPSAQDDRFIAWAIAQARACNPLLDPTIFDFIRRCLRHEVANPAAANLVRRFIGRFQQTTAPIAAKGVEDTALYRFHRLVSLNEVGNDPDVFGISAQAFHGANADRAARWPHTMLATSTHDNKRSEDVRNRINVLSEQPAALRLALRRWHRLTRSFVTSNDGREMPSLADRYLLYQTVLGSLPLEKADSELDGYVERIDAYLRKAAREAKAATSWVRPDPAYEQALSRFVTSALTAGPVLSELRARAHDTAWFGGLNSVSMTVLKLTAPGVPDIYQGTELIDLSLVDPDNRRPVDFALRAGLLEQFERRVAQGAVSEFVQALAQDPADGRLKLWAAWRLLGLRRQYPALFSHGSYTALRIRGTRRGSAVAFARRQAGQTLVVVAARKFAGIAPPGVVPTGPSVWASTSCARPSWVSPGATATDVLTAERITAGESIALSDALLRSPVAALLFDS
ncbi:MAG TPA: malto-oligosyltrehalose synthase [Burkholderiaceae bacterium]